MHLGVNLKLFLKFSQPFKILIVTFDRPFFFSTSSRHYLNEEWVLSFFQIHSLYFGLKLKWSLMFSSCLAGTVQSDLSRLLFFLIDNHANQVHSIFLPY